LTRREDAGDAAVFVERQNFTTALATVVHAWGRSWPMMSVRVVAFARGGQAWLPEQLRPDEVSLKVHTHDAIALHAG
jgi:hypothetical protein